MNLLVKSGVIYLLVLFSAALIATPMAEQEDLAILPHTVTKDEKRAITLLDKAVQHIEQQGAGAVTDFSSRERFIDRELYVFALRVDGRFLASGGSSTVLVGDTVLDSVDMFGKPFFREMIETAVDKGYGVVEYHWNNPIDSQGEPKRTLFRRVGDIIVAVGFYPSRATAFQARSFLDDAIKAMVTDEKAALAEFGQQEGRFIQDDLYVFVVDMQQGKFIAHGATPALIGKSHSEVMSPDGQPVITQMLDKAKQQGKGDLVYMWRNPTTGRTEAKHTYYRVLDNKLVGVGYYQR